MTIRDRTQDIIHKPASGDYERLDEFLNAFASTGVNFAASDRILGRDTAGAGAGEELTLSQILDFVGSAAQGDILYRGAATWTRLGAGSKGQVLQTGGASANPAWAYVTQGLNAYQILQLLGLTTNLQFCLDTGDEISLPSTATSWVDLTANGQDFFLGTTAGADATDPTPTGQVGHTTKHRYLAFDGGDFLTYDTTNETWMESIHQDSASFTLLVWVYSGDMTIDQRIFATMSNFGTDTGFVVTLAGAAGDVVQLAVRNAGAAVLTGATSASVTTVAEDTWTFVGLAVDEATGVGRWNINGVATTFTSTYSSPAAGSATGTLKIGAATAGDIAMGAGSRMGIACGWSRALSAAELANIFAATRGRYGV